MKHHGSTCDFTIQRNRELLQAYRHACSKRTFIVRREVCEEAANSPCSRFWVSEERAAVIVSGMLKGRYVLDDMSFQKREMFLEIFKRVTNILDEKPDAKLRDAVFDAVNSPAPRFYMTTRSVVQIIWQIRNGHYDHLSKRFSK